MNKSQIQERVNKLSPQQRQLLAGQLVAEPESTPGTAQLVAYISAKSEVDAGALKNHLGKRLPNHMVPTHIVALTELPKLPNGKVDLEGLPSPQPLAPSEPKVQDEFGSTEMALAKIWEEVLGFSPVGLHDNFFEIGGDSILSIQIVAKARDAGISFTPNQLFQYQSIAELTAAVEQTMDTPPSTEETGRSQPEGPSIGDISPEDLNKLMEQINEHRNKG